MPPLMLIPELESINKVTGFNDFVKLLEFVFGLIPHSSNVEGLSVDLVSNYHSFKQGKLSGWCYSNALFLHQILFEYGVPSVVFDYGIVEKKLTHSVVIAESNRNRYLLDPYFCRYYSINNKPITFDELRENLNNNKVRSVYGNSLKKVKQSNGSQDWTPQKLEETVLDSWVKLFSFNEIMNNRFGRSNPLDLILCDNHYTRILVKRDGKKFYDFF